MSNDGLVLMLEDLRRMTWDEVEAHVAGLERPLIEELARLHREPLSPDAHRARLVAIREERRALHEIRTLWRRLHRSPDAGPTQYIG